jgi:hypothetical protein
MMLRSMLLVLLLSSLASGYVLDTEHPLYSYMEGIYVFDNRADDGNNIAGTGTMVGTVEDADGFDVPITQTFQSWYNQFGSAYSFCLWHGGWTPGSWAPIIMIHSTTDDHSLILSRNGTSDSCALYHQNTQYLFSDLLTSELADPMMFSFTWATSDNVATAYDGNDVISTHSALVTPKTTCTDAGFAIGGTAMTVTRLYIFSTRLTPAQLGALEADPNSIFIQEEPPTKAADPYPAHEAVGVSTAVTLHWGAVAEADNYDIYCGTTGLELLGNVDANEYEPALDPGTAYQWRVDPNNEYGTTEGAVWSFTTALAKVTALNPADEQREVPVDQVLAWAASDGAMNYNVYLGPALGSLSLLANVTGTTYGPALAYGQAYDWRVDPNNASGATEGDTWTFYTTTESVVEPHEPEPEPEPTEVWRRTRPWQEMRVWNKRQGLEGWRKR